MVTVILLDILLLYSTKRNEVLKGYFDDIDGVEYTRILRHTPTRWLSLRPCVQRLLKYWEPLCCYFRDQPDVGRVRAVKRILEDPTTKPILCFIDSAFSSIDAYNQLFQVSVDYSGMFYGMKIHVSDF